MATAGEGTKQRRRKAIGRPRTHGSRVFLHVAVTDAQLKRWKRAAAAKGHSLARWVRELLDAGVKLGVLVVAGAVAVLAGACGEPFSAAELPLEVDDVSGAAGGAGASVDGGGAGNSSGGGGSVNVDAGPVPDTGCPSAPCAWYCIDQGRIEVCLSAAVCTCRECVHPDDDHYCDGVCRQDAGYPPDSGTLGTCDPISHLCTCIN